MSEDASGPHPGPGAPDPDPRPSLSRLDPDRAAQAASASRRPAPSRPPFDPRRLQWMAGAFAVVLVIVFSVHQLTAGNGTQGNAGVPAGAALRPFAAPLAASTLDGDANLDPPCTVAGHDRRALNTCLLLRRTPLVLAFFVTGASGCERSVDALQALAGSRRGVAFAAVAIRSSHAAARAAVRRNRWTIPVAYDRDGALGESLGIAVCPLLELVRRGGVVARRLVGDRWRSAAAIAGQLGVLESGR